MNITSIGTSYTPLRSSQSFGAVTVSDWVKDVCGLTDDKIKELNNDCPNALSVDVNIHKEDRNPLEVVFAHATYIDNKSSKTINLYDHDPYFHVSMRAPKSSSTISYNSDRFLKCMKQIIAEYNKTHNS